MSEQRYYCYLFEAKSIQSYLFRSGKLKEIISSSERLDALIDDDEGSPLYHVLCQLKIESNLLDENAEPLDDTIPFIYFTRCKGGAFFCYSLQQSTIQALRSLWTLTVAQLFPSLEYIDATSNENSLTTAIENARAALTADRNQPSRKLPYATPVMALCQRTGAIAHPVTSTVRRELGPDNTSDYLNWDSMLHLEAHAANRKTNCNRLLEKYSPETEVPLNFPNNLDNEFPYLNEDNKELALIHIDGNGMGLLVQSLQNSLKAYMQDNRVSLELRERTYRQVLRQFSSALCLATKQSAKDATLKLIERVGDKKNYLPIRPLVLGGDDMTCLVRSDLAIDFALDFCNAFEKNTEQQLSAINFPLSSADLPKYLTASGGIVFQKSGQPFITANEFAEQLCKYAKELTKKQAIDRTIGPAALAYHKLSSVMAANVNNTLSQVLSSTLNGVQIETGMYRFLVEPSQSNVASFAQLKRLLHSIQAPENQHPITTSKWRKLLGHLSQTDSDNLARTLSLYEKHADVMYMKTLKSVFADFGATPDNAWWYWPHPEKNNTLQTVISDLIILERYWLSATQPQEESGKCY